MASIEASPVENGIAESFDSFSLIPSPLDGEEKRDMADSQYDLGSNLPIQDVSTAEIQARLVELVEDNESMKEALKYNNVLMKEQLRTISEWHSQMTASLSQQKISLEEANLKIQELEKENTELRQQSVSISQHESTPSSDNEIDFEIVQAKKFKEDEDAKELLKEAEIKVSELLQLVDKQNEEISSLKAFCEINEKENTDLKAKLGDHNELKFKYESVGLQIKSYQETANQIQTLDEERVKLLTDLQEVDDKFVQVQNALERERINHSETKKLLRDLQEKYERIDKLFQIQSKDQKQKNEQFLSERELEAKRALEQIDELTAKLFDLEQQVEDRDRKIKQFSHESEPNSRQLEKIPILEGQLEVYKTDLNNQKEANQRLVQELSDLRTAVSFCSICGAGNAHADAAARGKGRWRQSSSHQEKFACPMCNFAFKDVQALENHVYTCIDKAG